MMLQFLFVGCVCIWSVENTVLDPSLYLSPIPPMTDTEGSGSAGLWSRSAHVKILPDSSDSSFEYKDEPSPKSNRKPNPMEKAKLFWPSLRESHLRIGTGSIQVPLTFSLSGIYGRYAAGTGAGMIGSSYGTVSEIGGTPVTSLVGHRGVLRTYPSIRIYGRDAGSVWSGWGNGKWGHYGKG